MNKEIIKFFLILLLFFSSFNSYAMQLSECQDINFVAQAADIIIQGEVVKVEAQRNKKGHVHTYVDIKVNRYVKGEGKRIITVKLPGGTIKGEDVGVWVSDTPSFQVGQAGYLCLRRPQNDSYSLNQFYYPICGRGMLEEL